MPSGGSPRRFSESSEAGSFPIPEPAGHFADPVLGPERLAYARSAYAAAASPMQVAKASAHTGDLRAQSEGHTEESGPTLMGAFTTLIHRITPIEDNTAEKVETLRLGHDHGRERDMVEESSPAAVWVSESPPHSPRTDGRMLPPPPADAGCCSPGWSYGGWGWNSLCGNADKNGDAMPYKQHTYADDNADIGKMSLFGTSDEKNKDAILKDARDRTEYDEWSFHTDALAVDRFGPPAAPVESMNRSLSDEFDKHNWPARNDGTNDYGLKAQTKREKFEELRQNVKAFLVPRLPQKVKSPKNLRVLECREGFVSCGRLLLNCPSRYTAAAPAKCPCACASIYFFIFLLTVIIGIAVGPMEIETDFDAFLKTDVNSSILRDTFKEAKSSREIGRRLGEQRRLQRMLFMQHDVYIAYEITDGVGARSIFDQAVLSRVAAFERALVLLPGWSTRCDKSAYSEDPLAADADAPLLCNPGISLAQYALPSFETDITQSIFPQKMTFDGAGKVLLPLDSTLRLVQQLMVEPIVFPIGFQKDTAEDTKVLRSVFRFMEYCCTSDTPLGERNDIVKRQKEEWKVFAEETVLPFLQERAGSYGNFRIFYGGSGFRDIEVRETLMNDSWLAAGGITFVLFYLLFHTQSFFLSFVGLVLVFLAVPFSYVAFASLAGTRIMNIATFLSLFLVIGLGSDVVFVYTDFWREAVLVKESDVDRLTYTLQRGGKASLATTITTALSFFANLASVLRPLREFGFFMGLCVIFVWVMLSLIFVPLCAVDTLYFQSFSPARFAPRCCGRGKRRKETSWQRSFGKLATCVHSWRRTLLVVAALQFIAYCTCVIILAETDSSMPNIFPADHNQNRGKEILETFLPVEEVMDPYFKAPKTDIHEDICHEHDFNENTQAACPLFWCEVQAGANAGDCSCYQKVRASCPNLVRLRFIGDKNLTSSLAQEQIKKSLPASVSVSSPVLQNLAPIYLDEWETGVRELMPVQHAKSFIQSSVLCGWDELCFCNTRICKLPSGWNPSGNLNYTGSSSSSLRLLSEAVWSVAPQQRATVSVVFGIDVRLESPLLGELDKEDMWSFSSSFDMSQPWSQRKMYEMCSSAPANLRVAAKSCWIMDFRRYVITYGGYFPVLKRNFQARLTEFLDVDSQTNLRASTDFMWLRDGGIIKACYVDFSVDVHKDEKVDAAIEYMRKWNTYLSAWNDEASRATRGAWHTSALWVKAEAQEELVSSTITTLVIVLCLAFVGMLAFTFDILLSIYVVLSTLLVLIGLAFFIVVVMKWEIGPVEVIALIVFIGYAVTYSLHIAHKYGSSDALEFTLPPPGNWDEPSRIRFQRTQFALKTMGSAALGSAATTTGCSVFLLFCTLSVFRKLGGVVLVVTLLSTYTAFFNLPALLQMIGPTKPGEYYWLLPWLNCKTHIDRLRGRLGYRQETTLALESSLSGKMLPEEELQTPADELQMPAAKQMNVRVLHTTQVPKPPGMRPSLEYGAPLKVESDVPVKAVSFGNGIDEGIVLKGTVVGINGNGIHQGGVQSPPRRNLYAEMDDTHHRGFDICEESARQPLHTGAVIQANIQNPSANMLTDRWQAMSPPLQTMPPPLGFPQDFTSRLPLQNQQGPSPDPQKPAPKKKATYALPRRDRFNGSRANTPHSELRQYHTQGQSVGRGSPLR